MWPKEGRTIVFSKKKKDDKEKNADQTLYCSFCGKSQHEVKKLIAGPTVFICNECVVLCMDIITEEWKSLRIQWQGIENHVPNADELSSALKDKIPDSDWAIKGLGFVLHRHFANLKTDPNGAVYDCQPAIALLRGTPLARVEFAAKLSKSLPVPFLAIDGFEAARIGDAEAIFSEVALALAIKADFNTERANQGMIYLDDLESLLNPKKDLPNGHAVSNAEFRDALMQLVSGRDVGFRPNEQLAQELVVSTRRLTFFLGDRFLCLDGIPPARWPHRVEGKVKAPPPLTEAQSEALIDSGLPSDLVARVTTLIDLQEQAGTL